MISLRVLVCLLCVCFVISQGPPFPIWPRCEAPYGNLRILTINQTTYPGFSQIHNLGYRGASVGYYTFNLTGRCVGQSYLPGAVPVVALVRHDGVPWVYANDARMELNEMSSFYVSQDHSYTPWVVAFHGYEGMCNIEMIVHYCECNPGYIGANCRAQHTPWGVEEVITPYSWKYHCIHQGYGVGWDEVVRAYEVTLSTTTNTSAGLTLTGRWGAPPEENSPFNREEARLLPGASHVFMNISYPRHESGIYSVNDTCYYIGVFNPSFHNVSYSINHTSLVCNGSYGDNCQYKLQHANFSQEVTTVINEYEWHVFEFFPHSLPMRHPIEYEFLLTTSEPSLSFYVRKDAPPSIHHYDYFNNETILTRTIRVRFPAYGPQMNSKWFAGVYRTTGTNILYFSIIAKAIYCEACTDKQGVCVSGNDTYPMCQCNTNFAGWSCESPIVTIPMDSRQSYVVPAGKINYHQFRIPGYLSPHGAIVNLYIHVPNSDPVMFMTRHNGVPTTYDYHARSMLPNNTFAIARPNLVENDIWYVSVTNFHNADAPYNVFLVLEEEYPVVSTSTGLYSISSSYATSSTTRHITTGTSSTTRNEPVIIPIVKNDPGAMAGLAFGMLAAGAGLAVGVIWFLRRRGYTALSTI